MCGSWESASGGLKPVSESLHPAEQQAEHRRATQHTNMQDVKELIPEFYFLSEFLTNVNEFDLGESANSGVRCAI
jgi:hypothetical protein